MKKAIIGFVIGAVIVLLFLFGAVATIVNIFSGNNATGSYATPITITGDIQGTNITMDFSGGITANGITGTIIDNTFNITGVHTESIEMELPQAGGARLNFCSYMPQFNQSLYDKQLDISSPQYKLNQTCYTDGQNFRKKGDAYLVALGSYYGKREHIGNTYKISFRQTDGTIKTINTILGDIKSDKETDTKHQYHLKGDGTVVEFIMGTRDDENNRTIQNNFGTVISITKSGVDMNVAGAIKGETIKINGKANGIPFAATGHISDGHFVATGMYGAGAGGDLLWPTDADAPITSYFGDRDDVPDSPNHTGIDIGVAEGTNVIAAAAGDVTVAGSHGGYGKAVVIDHGGGMVTIYGHNSAVKVGMGDRVTQGQVIALSGNTGHSYGPHLHFEVKLNGAAVDPLQYIKRK